MDIKKYFKKITALLLTLAVVLGMTISLSAISSADGGEFTPLEIENLPGETPENIEDTEEPKNEEEKTTPQNDEAKSDDIKPEGKSGPATYAHETLPPTDLQLAFFDGWFSKDTVGLTQEEIIIIPVTQDGGGNNIGELDFDNLGTLVGPNKKENTTYVINKPGTYTIKGTSNAHRVDAIRVLKGTSDVRIILDGVTIETTVSTEFIMNGSTTLMHNGAAPITIEGDAANHSNVTVELKVGTVNTLTAFKDEFVGAGLLYPSRAALEIRFGSKLTIEGEGTLIAKSAPNEKPTGGTTLVKPNAGFGGGAGIGGGGQMGRRPGDIYIKSGNITAEGATHGSGIGSGWNNHPVIAQYNILIVGGNITSTGGLHGNGIGGSCRSAGGGAIVVVPPSNVVSRSKASDITDAMINDPLNKDIIQNLKDARSSYGDIGSTGSNFANGNYTPHVFYMGKETTGAVVETNTAVYGEASGFNNPLYTVFPAQISAASPPEEDMELVLDIVTGNKDTTMYKAILPALNLYDGDIDAFFSELSFGTLTETQTTIQRISLLAIEGTIKRKGVSSDQAFESTKVGPTEETKEFQGYPVELQPYVPKYMAGIWTTTSGLLAFKTNEFDIDTHPTANETEAAKLMYGFIDSEAGGSKFEFIAYNTKTKTSIGGKDFDTSQDIANLKLYKDGTSMDIDNFTMNGVDTASDNLLKALLKTLDNPKDNEDSRAIFGFTPKSKVKVGTEERFMGLKTHTVEGSLKGDVGKNTDFSYTQEIVKGDYLESGINKESTDTTSTVVNKTRLENHFKVTDAVTSIVTPTPVVKGINQANNKVKIENAIIDKNLTTNGVTTTKYVVQKKNSKIPAVSDTSWISLPANGEVSFTAGTNEEMVIYYLVENPWITTRGLVGTYDVDLIEPEVKKVEQVAVTGSTSGYISVGKETISFEFTENIWGFDHSDIEITRVNGQGNLGHFKVISSAVQGNDSKPTLQIQIDPTKIDEIVNLEYIDISVKNKVVEDRLANKNKSSALSSAGTSETILRLRFVNEKPTVLISDDIESNKKVFKHNPKTIDVTIDAKNVTTTLNGAMYRAKSQLTLLTSAEVSAPLNFSHYKEYIVVTDLKTNTVVNYESIDYTPNNITGGKFTINFGPNGLADGDYKITVKEDYIFNELSIPAEFKEGTFSVRAPAISQNGAVIDKTSFESTGGQATITINGKYLTEASELTIIEETGQIADVVIKPPTDDNKIDTIITFPKNSSYDDVMSYKFRVEGKIPGEPDIGPVVVVAKSNPTAGQATVTVKRLKSVVKFDLNGGSPKISDIVGDKAVGNKSGFFDFTEYDYGNSKVPGKKDHMFVGWYLDTGERAKEKLDLNVRGGGVYILKAMWVDLSGLVDEDDDGGDKTDPEKHGDAKIFVVNPARDTSRYVGENTFAEILASIGGYVEITPLPGYEKIRIPLEFIWSNSDMTQAGVKSGKVAILNPQTKEPILQHFTTYVYITNYPYISNRSLVTFYQYDRDTGTGSEWSPKVVEEVPDFSTKRIVIKNHQTKYDHNGFTTELIGDYNVLFNATITTYRGVGGYIVPQSIGRALVLPRDEDAEAKIGQSIAEDKYWINASKSLHLLYSGEGWQIDKYNYTIDGEKVKDFKVQKGYDRKVLAEANGFPMMSAEFLQIVKEQSNSLGEVRYGEIIWKFYSTNFKDEKILPTGHFDLGYKNGNTNEKINALVGTRTQQQISFRMNKTFMGKGEITIKLEKALRASTSVNLFHYNEGSNELELVGKMTNNKDGTASILLGEVRNDYVILTGLSKDKSSDKVLSYRITDVTNELEGTGKSEVEKDLKSVGKDIKSITAKIADEDSLKLITSQDNNESNESSRSGQILLVTLIILSFASAFILYFYYKKRNIIEDTEIN